MCLHLSLIHISEPTRQAEKAPQKDLEATPKSSMIKYRGGSYAGDLLNGVPHGAGTLKASDGYIYSGEFKVGKFNGQGTQTWADGRKYVGQFKDDKRHGHGTYIDTDGSRYVGKFKAGKQNLSLIHI